jgi:hypothetical protein
MKPHAKQHPCTWVLALMLASGTCWSYGGSSSSKACAKPKFSDFTPAENAEIAPNSGFSFTASKNTYPTTLKVTVKDTPVDVQITQENEGTFHVTGKLPSALQNTFARIVIAADAQNNCKGTGGWLVKIAGTGD